jgi:ABC-type nickel/cobalt efflux system permease component RcnA
MKTTRVLKFAALAATVVLVAVEAKAAKSPFGIATPDSSGNYFGGPLGPIFAWIAFHQAHFYRALTGALSSLKQDPAGLWLLFGLSFAYGVFHAVGPGHGKAVITSYLLASGASARRGIALSFLAAMVQAISAVVIVAIGAIVLRVSAVAMTFATDWIEIVSYGAIALFGAWLLWAKIRGDHHHHHHHVVAPAGAGHADHAHEAHDPTHDHGLDEHAREHDHGHEPARVHASGARRRPLITRAWTAVLAVGIRPCSGAIIILVFALAQGIFAAGVAATFVMALGTGLTVAALATFAVTAKDVVLRFAGGGSVMVTRLARGVEIGGAAAVLLLGLLLLGGSLYSGLPGS